MEVSGTGVVGGAKESSRVRPLSAPSDRPAPRYWPTLDLKLGNAPLKVSWTTFAAAPVEVNADPANNKFTSFPGHEIARLPLMTTQYLNNPSQPVPRSSASLMAARIVKPTVMTTLEKRNFGTFCWLRLVKQLVLFDGQTIYEKIYQASAKWEGKILLKPNFLGKNFRDTAMQVSRTFQPGQRRSSRHHHHGTAAVSRPGPITARKTWSLHP